MNEQYPFCHDPRKISTHIELVLAILPITYGGEHAQGDAGLSEYMPLVVQPQCTLLVDLLAEVEDLDLVEEGRVVVLAAVHHMPRIVEEDTQLADNLAVAEGDNLVVVEGDNLVVAEGDNHRTAAAVVVVVDAHIAEAVLHMVHHTVVEGPHTVVEGHYMAEAVHRMGAEDRRGAEEQHMVVELRVALMLMSQYYHPHLCHHRICQLRPS